jgi:hypothetical protein
LGLSVQLISYSGEQTAISISSLGIAYWLTGDQRMMPLLPGSKLDQTIQTASIGFILGGIYSPACLDRSFSVFSVLTGISGKDWQSLPKELVAAD